MLFLERLHVETKPCVVPGDPFYRSRIRMHASLMNEAHIALHKSEVVQFMFFKYEHNRYFEMETDKFRQVMDRG